MTRMRMFLIVFVVCGISIGGFLAGRASAQQVMPPEVTTQYQFPRSWGDFRTVVPGGAGGYTYFFEAADGAIHTVSVANGSVLGIQVTQRSGAATRGGPGQLR